MLTLEQILELFNELNDELAKSETRGDVFVVGGAAMAVAYDARPATRDVDAIFHPSSEVRSAAERVAALHDGIERDWLNDGVKGFLSGEDEGKQVVLYEGDYLTVRAASPEYLLATKLLASRVSRDEDDILFLFRLCELSTVDEALDLLVRYYGNRPIEAKVRFLLEELLYQ
jgi:hypothetical protein